jgi:hypothetical protein
MKKIRKKIVLIIFSFICVIGTLCVVKFHQIEKLYDHLTKQGGDDDDGDAAAIGQMEMLWWSKAYPNPTGMTQKYLNAWDVAQELKRERENVRGTAGVNGALGVEGYGGTWTSIGPNTGIGGRILTIAVNPKRSNSVYIGSASGGIWKTYNAQATTPTWQPVTTNLATLGVSSIIISPVDTNTIYAGTGEIYRIDSTNTTLNPSTTGFNTWKTRGTWGIGVIKSTDGGTTWSQSLVKSENSLFGIQKMRFDPNNPDTVYAAATDGLYRSVNAGGAWTKILPKTLVEDVVIDAKNSTSIVVSVGNLDNTDKGIYQSLNFGSTWTKITSGLPASIEGCTKFDNVTSVGNRDTIWASIGVAETGSPDELYRSTNFGTTWTSEPSSNHTSYQFWYSHCVAINPTSTGSLVFAGVDLYSYSYSGTSSSSVSIGHTDIHDIKFDPENSNYVYLACDGGMYRSTNAGSSFSAINTGLYAVQFYASVGVGSTATDAALVVGGLQDNGVVKYNGSTSTWSGFPSLTGTDGASCAVDPTNNANVVASGDARQVYLSANTGGSSSQILSYWGEVHDSRTAFVAPLAIAKSAPATFYVGTDELFKTTNSGTSWVGTGNSDNPGTNYIDALHKTAITLAVSPTNASKVYASTSPFSQFDGDIDSLYYTPPTNVLRTTTGNIPFSVINGTTNALPGRYVMDFAISPTHDDSVWVAVAGFGGGHVYVTPDGGVNWYNKDSGLPDVPANAVMLDPANPKIIYIGNDMGVYVSPDNGTTWQDFSSGFWDATMVMDLEPYPGNKILAATHGKGAFISPLYSVSLPVTLTNFSGYNNNSGLAVLQWSTSIESGIKQYELQRSTDDINFAPVTDVPARNINNSSYSYNDNISGIHNTPVLYYRLMITSIDGTIQYSNIVNISLNPQSGITIAGNPFTDQFTIIFTTLAPVPAEARLIDASGRLLVRKDFSLQAGLNNLSIQNLNALAKGVYLVEFIVPSQRFTRRVVKK